MTNGEKIISILKPRKDQIRIYGNWVEMEIQKLGINFSCGLDWWNAEYKELTTKNDLGVDAISRADVLKLMQDNWHTHNGDWAMQESMDDIRALPAATPQEPKKGEWLRMSDLSEQEDDRYKCSRCGNVIHHKNKMDLYTFNSWCGRCGSDNGRHINYEVEE